MPGLYRSSGKGRELVHPTTGPIHDIIDLHSMKMPGAYHTLQYHGSPGQQCNPVRFPAWIPQKKIMRHPTHTDCPRPSQMPP